MQGHDGSTILRDVHDCKGPMRPSMSPLSIVSVSSHHVHLIWLVLGLFWGLAQSISGDGSARSHPSHGATATSPAQLDLTPPPKVVSTSPANEPHHCVVWGA
ncbi:hypothetical protein VTK73DRAFT_629 [Phialemonium thermophilum]|uniref:Uncharacterized protein n=1 Tax=Phialemonium thermophilum TaxID=223376 RepID=A0ABR3VUQ6_9PEZI